MPEITRRRTGELLLRLFEILMSHADGVQAKEALGALASSVELTSYELGSYPAGGRRFEKIVRFATVDVSKAGWLLKSKGRWTLTAKLDEAARRRLPLRPIHFLAPTEG